MKKQRKSKFVALFSILAMILVGAGITTIKSRDAVNVKAAPTTVTVHRSDFSGGTGYAEGTWSKGGISGVGFIYFATADHIQVSTNAGRRPYPYNTTITPGPITSISVKMPGTGTLRTLTPRVSATAQVTTETSGVALEEKEFTSNTQTLTWTISSSSNYRYFQLVPGGNTNWEYFSFTYEETSQQQFGALDSIEVDASNAQKRFYVGDEFDPAGLVVVAKDTNSPPVTKFVTNFTTNYDNHTFIQSDIGENKEVVVTYKEGSIEKTDQYNIKVEPLPDYKYFTKITSVSQLIIGASYVIAGDKESVTWVMSTIQGSNNRTAITATIVSSLIKETENTQMFTLEEGTTEASYSFKAENGDTAGQYIYAAGGTEKNYLNSTTTKDAKGSWTINVSSAGVSAITAIDSGTTRNQLKLNNDNAIFSAYSSGQIDVSLYIDEDSVPSFGTLDHISINSTSVKKAYYIGDQFSSEKLIVTAYDGSDETTANSKTVTGWTTNFDGVTFNSSHLGTKQVVVSYIEGGVTKTSSYNITISEAPVMKEFSKISSVDDLHIGATYVISGLKTTTTYVMTTTQNSNNRGAEVATLLGVKIEETLTIQKFELVEGTKTNTYGFKAINGDTAGKYIYAASSSSNHLKSESTLSDNSSFAITFSGTTLSAVAQGSNTRNKIMFNAGSDTPLFSCYSGGQEDISLYIDEDTIPQGSSVYNEAKAFADFVMGLTDAGHITTSDCEDNFLAAWLEWDELSSEAKALFKIHEDFTEARQRFTHWAFVNGFSSLDALDGINTQTNLNISSSQLISIIVIVSILGISTLVGYYFIRKRPKDEII